MSLAPHVAFAVADEPYCGWGDEIAQGNLRFVESIDERYFEFVSETYAALLGGENAQRAALALRANYHLCLETLFSLMGAALQAPNCVPGWILKATARQLRDLVKALDEGTMRFHVKWSSPKPLASFEDVAAIIFEGTEWAAQRGDKTVENFSALWSRLAADFLDPYCIKEYNSIKHGFRARAGGFSLAMGLQPERGVPASPKDMKPMGGSAFGTSFYSAEPVTAASPGKSDPHFTLRHNAMNWLPADTALRMHLAAMSIANIKAFLSNRLGGETGKMPLLRPQDDEAFDLPWRKSPGLTSMHIDLALHESEIHRATKDELRSKLTADRNGP